MKILFTLDYELFLGRKTGSVKHCLIEPMDNYLQASAPYGMRFTIFVDASYLFALKKYANKHDCIKQDYEMVKQHLLSLQSMGHDLQLHIHPQWYFSTFDGEKWNLDTEHYKLADIAQADMLRLVRESKDLLDSIIGKKTIAFRGGGFSVQPTELLTKMMEENHLLIDSSVCPGMHYQSTYQSYDYRHAKPKGLYRFEDDVCQERADGRFWELPLSMHKVGPSFQWRLLLVRLIPKFVGNSRHATYGDGTSIRTSRKSIFNRLLSFSNTMATIDGYKIYFLKEAIKRHTKKGMRVMCILGHPKLATPYSVEKLPNICAFVQEQGHEACTLTELVEAQAMNRA